MAMLGIRMCELKSIEYGSRIAHKNPMFVEGVAQVACKTPVGAYILVTDPVDSLYRTAEGIKRIAAGEMESRRRPRELRCAAETGVPLVL